MDCNSQNSGWEISQILSYSFSINQTVKPNGMTNNCNNTKDSDYQ